MKYGVERTQTVRKIITVKKNNHDAISSAEQRSTVDSRRCLTT